MYFLKEFAQERSTFRLVFRHLVYIVVGSCVLLSISELNFVGTLNLEGLLFDVELASALGPSLHAPWRAFRRRVARGSGELGVQSRENHARR
mmetsp:Transcript_152649/g.487761  ORF Transcript_152649/g.487761 Transcript_152649/m.487761 type:complete len:92 (+) Transcript_152649:1563-1838(+)